MQTKTKTKRVQKLITFSPKLYLLANKRAKNLGLSFPEYIRHLLATIVEKEAEYFPMVDEETEKRIGKSLKALENGEYIEVNPSDTDALKKTLGLK